MTVKIKLYTSEIISEKTANAISIATMEDQINEFLKDKTEEDIRKINIVIGPYHRIAIIEYKEPAKVNPPPKPKK